MPSCQVDFNAEPLANCAAPGKAECLTGRAARPQAEGRIGQGRPAAGPINRPLLINGGTESHSDVRGMNWHTRLGNRWNFMEFKIQETMLYCHHGEVDEVGCKA